jgi:hypothetical protein
MLIDAPGYEAPKIKDDKGGNKPTQTAKPLDDAAIEEILKNIPK